MLKITAIVLNENGREIKQWFVVPSEEALKDVLAQKGWELVITKSVKELSDDEAKKLAPESEKKLARPQGKKISEMKATCRGCGNVYFFGKQDESKYRSDQISNCGSSMEDAGSSMMCCGGCWPAAFLPKSQTKQTVDPNRCPKCGSRAITKEKVTHFV